MDKIEKIAEKMVNYWHGKFEVEELIDTAYIKYRTAIENNPSLVDSVFSNLTTFLWRVKNDMKDYIKKQTGIRTKEKKKMLANTITHSFQRPDDDNGNHGCISFFEPQSIDKGQESVDNCELLNEIFKKVELTDREWKVIQGYFWEGKTTKEVGIELGSADKNASGTTCNIKNKIVKKLQKQALLLV
jgi:RNA polymerase sigma factor (sigma-70 family)